MEQRTKQVDMEKITNKQKMHNKNVPEETVWRNAYKNAKVEIGQLKSEIDELKYILECRDKAIREFKKWQAKVASYKWQYWLNEGLQLASEKPDEHTLEALKAYLSKHEGYERQLAKAQKAYNKLIVAQEILKRDQEMKKEQENAI